MSSSIAALPPSDHHIQHQPEYDGAPDVPEIAFSDLWQDKGKGFSFGDFLDIINPLQHIPVVSTIYRMATEDNISPGARVAGGALFGGPLGLIGAGITALFEETSGNSVEKHIAALWDNVTGDDAPATQVAANAPAGSTTARSQAPEDNDILAYADNVNRTPPVTPDSGSAADAKQINAEVAQTVSAAPPSPQPVLHAAATEPVLAASQHIQAAAIEPVRADPAAERQRIAQSIDRARQAQAGLLLANVAAERQSSKQATETKSEPTDALAVSQVQPFRSHPYLLPRGAPPELVSRAMEQALAKYQATLQQRATPAPVAAPVPAPAATR